MITLFSLEKEQYTKMLSYRDGFEFGNDNCDGCGSSWNEKLVPDDILGLDIRPVCCIHDDRYITEYGERVHADIEFLLNMLTVVEKFGKDHWWYPTFWARHRAVTYYHFVREYGEEYWNNGK